jgi:hypothetical protein
LTIKDIAEFAKNFVGVVSAIAALGESRYPLLPVNPAIRSELLGLASLLAAVCGLGAHQHAKRTGKSLGALSLAVLFLAAITIIAAGKGGLDWLSPRSVSVLVRVAYVAFFSALGATFGAFTR